MVRFLENQARSARIFKNRSVFNKNKIEKNLENKNISKRNFKSYKFVSKKLKLFHYLSISAAGWEQKKFFPFHKSLSPFRWSTKHTKIYQS